MHFLQSINNINESDNYQTNYVSKEISLEHIVCIIYVFGCISMKTIQVEF
jgi:hypothetical protein